MWLLIFWVTFYQVGFDNANLWLVHSTANQRPNIETHLSSWKLQFICWRIKSNNETFEMYRTGWIRTRNEHVAKWINEINWCFNFSFKYPRTWCILFIPGQIMRCFRKVFSKIMNLQPDSSDMRSENISKHYLHWRRGQFKMAFQFLAGFDSIHWIIFILRLINPIFTAYAPQRVLVILVISLADA